MEWKKSDDIEYLKVIFPDEKSAELLIMFSLKISNSKLIVMPFLPNMSILELLHAH